MLTMPLSWRPSTTGRWRNPLVSITSAASPTVVSEVAVLGFLVIHSETGDLVRSEPEAAAREKSLQHIVATKSQPKLEAWQSRLGHRDLRRADTKAVSDLQGILIQPLGGQVLTENAPWQNHVRKLASPIGVVFARINVGRLVRPTMHR